MVGAAPQAAADFEPSDMEYLMPVLVSGLLLVWMFISHLKTLLKMRILIKWCWAEAGESHPDDMVSAAGPGPPGRDLSSGRGEKGARCLEFSQYPGEKVRCQLVGKFLCRFTGNPWILFAGPLKVMQK